MFSVEILVSLASGENIFKALRLLVMYFPPYVVDNTINVSSPDVLP